MTKGDISMNSPKPVQPGPKRPYAKPQVACERVFETTALACGTVLNAKSTCDPAKKKVNS